MLYGVLPFKGLCQRELMGLDSNHTLRIEADLNEIVERSDY